MPTFNFDPNKAQVSFDVLPKGEYEFTIGEPKPFFRQNSKGEDSYGIRFAMKCVTPGLESKRVQPYSCYMQSEGGQSFTKQFLMAALGYEKGPKEEQRFNEDMGGKDWSFDPESGSVGSAYSGAQGSRIIGIVDVSIDKDTGAEQQQWKGWRSITTKQ